MSQDTISRWAKAGLKAPGIDTTQFTTHSTRAAVSSKAKDRDLPLDVILATFGWGSAASFQKFYYKPMIQQPSVAETVLQLYCTLLFITSVPGCKKTHCTFVALDLTVHVACC